MKRGLKLLLPVLKTVSISVLWATMLLLMGGFTFLYLSCACCAGGFGARVGSCPFVGPVALPGFDLVIGRPIALY